jgi:hypothetical protein
MRAIGNGNSVQSDSQKYGRFEALIASDCIFEMVRAFGIRPAPVTACLSQ